MTLFRKILVLFFLLFPISNSWGVISDEVQNAVFNGNNDDTRHIRALAFNPEGTKAFLHYQNGDGDFRFIAEFNLSTPFDISTRTYAGDSERCELSGNAGGDRRIFDISFSSDGLKIFIARGSAGGEGGDDKDKIFRYDLTSPYDISTCSFAQKTTNFDGDALQQGSQADAAFGGTRPGNTANSRAQGVAINPDGKKLFVMMMQNGDERERILEYNLSTPYDLTTISLVTTAGIALTSSANPMSLFFSSNGKRLFFHDHNQHSVTQISLDSPYDTSSFTIDGSVDIRTKASANNISSELAGLSFSTNGLKIFLGNDQNDGTNDRVLEFNLSCPFNIIAGKCPSITENSDRTGMALAQIEIAKRTIDHATDSAVNRLKWIRRNKDKQNLTNLNINFNFTNQRLASLTEVVKASSSKMKKKNKDEDVFYWSEGSIAIGRIGDTSISSTKKIDTDAITFGADKFTKENGIKGLAFRVGRNNVDVGTGGSNLDTDTYNITYYSTTPIEDDTKFLDTFIGIGKLKSDLLTVLDGRNLTANRTGKQIYGTIRLKDEIKKDNFTFIPSGRFDIGHTILGSYKEVGTGGIDVESQHIRTKKIRAGFSAVQDLSDDKYTLKRHGKIEYVIDLDRSSNFKYTYSGDSSVNFSDTLHSEALHNINGEIGIDIVLQNNFSVFLIYERNQALGSGHTDKVHIAIGYLPNKKTNYAFSITGGDELKSNYVLSKNINDYIIDFKLTNNALRPEEFDEASLNLIRKF